MSEISLKDKIDELRNINDKLSSALNSAESKLDLYKSVIDEVREYIKLISSDYDTLYNQDIELVIKHLLEILNKVKENK